MASWILVPCLVSLRNEFNKLAPSRDKATDGSIGDTSHAAGASDHNPDETGNTPSEDADNTNEVHAIDVDTDLKKAGWNMQRCVDIIVGNHRAGRDNRLQNVIYNRRIASASWGWTWRDYTGTSPHTEHAHFSARYTTAQENDQSPWGLLKEDDDLMTISQADFNKLMDGWSKTPVGAAALNGMSLSDPVADKVAKGRTIGAEFGDLADLRAVLRFVATHPEAKAAGYPADAPLVKLLATPGVLDQVRKDLATVLTRLPVTPAK